MAGGQRWRVSLARACYSDAEFFLLDDPLSALDMDVGVHVFKEVILGLLRARTVCFVTHQLDQLVSLCDQGMQVAVLKAGRIVQSGSPAELMAQPGLFADLASRQMA